MILRFARHWCESNAFPRCEQAILVLERSIKRPVCEPFLHPVDPDEPGCEGYLEVRNRGALVRSG